MRLLVFALMGVTSMVAAEDFGTAMLPPRPKVIHVAVDETEVWQGDVTVTDFAVAGVLLIKDNTSVHLRTLHILPGAKLIIGDADAPVKNVTLTFGGIVDTDVDHFQWQVGLLCEGYMETHGAQIGGTLFGKPDLSQMRSERVGGKGKFLWQHIRNPSERGIHVDGSYQINRPIRIESGEGSTAHVAFLHGSSCHLRGVWFYRLGRTLDRDLKADPPIPPQRDWMPELGPAENQEGRYSCHFHHAGQGPFVIEDCTVSHSVGKWGFVSHDTWNIAFTDCFTWKALGAGFVREGTKGEGIKFLRCVPASTRGQVNRFKASTIRAPKVKLADGTKVTLKRVFASGSVGFWFDCSQGMEVEDCASLDNQVGYEFNGRFSQKPTKNWAPYLNKNNLAEGCQIGLWSTQARGMREEDINAMPLRIENFSAIKCKQGVEIWDERNIEFVNLSLIADPARAADAIQPEKSRDRFTNQNQYWSVGVSGKPTYRTTNILFRGMTIITGYGIGVKVPNNSDAEDGTGLVFEGLRSACHLDVIVQASSKPVTQVHKFGFTKVLGSPDLPNHPIEAKELTLLHAFKPQYKSDAIAIWNGETHVVNGYQEPEIMDPN